MAAWALAVVCLLMLVALALGVTLRVDQATPSPTISGNAPRPVVVPVERTDARVSYQVTLVAREAPVRVVRLGGPGVVTAVFVKPGMLLRQGDPVVAVDDQTVYAMGGPAPLFRDLSPGSSGPDVLRLDRFLASIGRLDADPSTSFGTSTALAVRAYNMATGRSALGSTFLASSVAWIGEEPLDVGTVAMQVGDRAGVDSPLLRSQSRLGRVVVAEPPAGVPSAAGGYTLAVGNIRVAYAAGSGAVARQQEVERLAPVFIHDSEAVATLKARRPAPVLRVPAASVVVDAQGSTCVYPTATSDPVPVTVLGGELGVVDLERTADVSEVLANPAQVLDALTCTS